MKWFIVLALLFAGNVAYADRGGLIIPSHPLWKEECGSCHIDFPPQLLSGDNWQQLMGRLDDHFGANASMDSKDVQSILKFLQDNAGSAGRHSSSDLRITSTPWFKREHREVPEAVWTSAEVKSHANCIACHVNGDKGDWSERGIKMPGGKLLEEFMERRDDDD